MSPASRAIALQHAAAVHHSSGDPTATLETAEAFSAFIDGAAEEPAAPVKAAKVAAKPAAPAKKPKAAAPVEDDAEDEDSAEGEEGDATAEAVGEKVEELLNANLRDETIALFKKFKAKSLSGLKPADYAKFITGADDLLMKA